MTLSAERKALFTCYRHIPYNRGMKHPKNILITGASSGIGAALAKHYAGESVHLFLSGRDAARLKEICDACEERGAVTLAQVVDVSDKQDMMNWIDGIVQNHRLDLVIANAGISGGTGGRQEGEPIAEARKIFDVNVMGVFNTIEPVLQVMQDQEMPSGENHKGQIAIVSSLAGFRGWPSSPAYSASKGAVRFYGEALRGALKGSDIAVNVICPGFVKSRITDQNDFPMPFKMEADKAASIIARGLSKNKGRICFPLPMHFMSWFIGILPDAFAQKILAKAPAKSALGD